MAEAKPVVDAITALGIITLESREAIEAARAAYEALSEEAKTMVTNLSDLVIAEKDLAVLEAKEKLEQAAKMRAFMTGSPEVEADAADKTIVVTWDAYADAKSYEVYRREGNQAAKCVAEVTGQSYTDSDISAGQTYTYTVRAVSDKWGETVYSEEAPEVTAGITLGKGTITRAQSWGYNAVKITWDQVEGADGYRLYCTDKPGSAWKYVTQIGKGDITSYVHKGRTTGTTYTYYMRAYRNVDGGKAFGAYSAGRNVKPVPKTTVISKVTGGSKAAAVSWNRVNGASGYRLYYKTSKAGSWKYVTQIGKGSTTTYTHKGLKTGQTVYYKMRAYRTVGGEKVFGAYSAESSVKVK